MYTVLAVVKTGMFAPRRLRHV